MATAKVRLQLRDVLGRPLDDPDLAVRVCHRSSCLFNALPMVPSAATLSDGPANHSDLKILRSTAI